MNPRANLVQAWLLVTAAACSFACQKKSGPVEPGKFDDFVTRIGAGGITPAPNCSKANEGKAYTLEGFLHLASSMSLDAGSTRLQFFGQNDAQGLGTGESFQVKVSLGNWLSKGDIDDLWDSATNVKAKAYKVQEGEIDEAALRIHLADGSTAGAKDRIKLDVAVEMIPNIDPKAPPNCDYVFLSANKL